MSIASQTLSNSAKFALDLSIVGLGYVGLPTALALHDRGRRVVGVDINADRLASIRIPLDRPSIFFTLREGGSLLRGPLAELPAHAELRGLLGSAASSDLLVLPLRVRERLAAALLIVPEATLGAGDTLAELQSLAAKAAIALELCIMRKKLHKA